MQHSYGTDKPVLRVPFPHAYWVIPDRFMAGGYPGANRPDQTIDNLKCLFGTGVRLVINLMKPEELCCSRKALTDYAGYTDGVADSMGISVDLVSMPIKDTWVPSRREMCRILDRIDRALENEKPVYLHCWGGRGRTGTVVGCYLARHGLDLQGDSLRLLQKLRKNTENSQLPSPETFIQSELVNSWVKWE
ncbi:MAG: hypothetical protein PHQ97_08405 [Desulfobacterales bacterium]|nr:hypothetical protein [Desulfobacterales bacterium]